MTSFTVRGPKKERLPKDWRPVAENYFYNQNDRGYVENITTLVVDANKDLGNLIQIRNADVSIPSTAGQCPQPVSLKS